MIIRYIILWTEYWNIITYFHLETNSMKDFVYISEINERFITRLDPNTQFIISNKMNSWTEIKVISIRVFKIKWNKNMDKSRQWKLLSTFYNQVYLNNNSCYKLHNTLFRLVLYLFYFTFHHLKKVSELKWVNSDYV